MYKKLLFLALVIVSDFLLGMAPNTRNSAGAAHSRNHEQTAEEKCIQTGIAVYQSLYVALNLLPPDHSFARQEALRVIKNRAEETLTSISPINHLLTRSFIDLIKHVERLQLSPTILPPQEDF